MYIKDDYGFNDLKDKCWSGAIDTLEEIEKAGKEEEFMEYLENVIFGGEIPTITEVNDFIRFEDEMILEDLEINDDEESEEE